MMWSKGKLLLILTALIIITGGGCMAAEIDYEETLTNVSCQIESLKAKFPQLVEFSSTENTNLQNLSISYAYHTHQALDQRGWISAVPNPDPDGIWFYIDFHDPDSTAQIHTQPVVETRTRLGDKTVLLLISQGNNTKSLQSTIWSILEYHVAKAREPK
jgi:hypothetical protein